MADKSKFVDMISEATRQARRRRIAPRAEFGPGQGSVAPQSLAAGSLGAVADGHADPVEGEAVEGRRLELIPK